MTDRRLFGTEELVEAFTGTLTMVGVADGGWSTKYLEPETGRYLLKYVFEDHGFYTFAMLISPVPTTDDLIEIALTSSYPDEVLAAAVRMRIEEQEDKREFRQALINKLGHLDLSSLSTSERERIRTIIQSTGITNDINRRDATGKSYGEVLKDASVYQLIAEKALDILKRI